MLKRLAIATAILTAVATLSTACNGDSPKTSPGGTDASTASTTTSPSADDVRAFFEALASNDVATMESASRLAAPESMAALYLQHQTALAVALRDGGTEAHPADRLEVKGDAFETCATSKGQEECATYGAIETKGSQVSSFTVDGKDLRGRLLAGGPKWFRVGDLAEVRVITAYQGVKGDLFIALDLRNTTSQGSVAVESRTAYRTPEGRQVQLGGQSGPTSVQPDSTAHLAVAFSAADLGGDLRLQLFEESGGSRSAAVEISLR